MQKARTRTLFKYVPLVSGGQEPIIEEHDEFKVTIPYLMAGPTAETKDNVLKDVLKDVLKELTERQQIIISNVLKDTNITISSLANILSVDERTVRRDITELKKQGILIREGGRKEGQWHVNLSAENEK